MRSLILLCLYVLVHGSMHAITTDELLRNHINALGGMKALNSLTNLKVTGKIVTQGMEAPFTQYFKNGTSMRMEMEMMGSSMIQAVSPKGAWAITPWEGTKATKLQPEQADALKKKAHFKSELISASERKAKITVGDAVDVDGATAYAVTIDEGDSADVRTMYIDAITWLPIKTESTLEMMGEKAKMVMQFGEYQSVAGVQLPRKIEVFMNGQSQVTITWDTADTTAVIDDSLFDMPTGG
ncbi:MAG: outer membrane lipoprotein-sorting protein [Bacteroidetes bacterium]|nr:MAG: outer membrane lipoprotein-sorting protein [Bacteroidota bacterium]MBZ0195284.1 hypothetical protein [Candidatus Kapabacteria bacterium]